MATNLTSTLLNHHIAPKLEMVLDREAKISHETFAVQIEAKLGSGEGENARGPDMKLWNKGRGLNEVWLIVPAYINLRAHYMSRIDRSIGTQQSFAILQLSSPRGRNPDMI